MRCAGTVTRMIIVAGWLRVDADERQAYLDGCRAVIASARTAPGCLDFHLSADPIDAERINVFERWENAESVERFRGAGPSDDQQRAITAARVEQYEIASTTPLS